MIVDPNAFAASFSRGFATANAELTAFLAAFVERMWRDGRHPIPRDPKTGRWVGRGKAVTAEFYDEAFAHYAKQYPKASSVMPKQDAAKPGNPAKRVRTYTGSDYSAISSPLRRTTKKWGGEPYGPSDYKFTADHVEGMREELSARKIPQPVRVSRSVKMKNLQIHSPEDMQRVVGATYADPALISVGAHHDVNINGDMFLDIMVPEGLNYIDARINSGVKSEQELILPENTRLRIIAAKPGKFGELPRLLAVAEPNPPAGPSIADIRAGNFTPPKSAALPGIPAKKFETMSTEERADRFAKLTDKKVNGGGLTKAETTEYKKLSAFRDDMKVLKKRHDDGGTLSPDDARLVSDFFGQDAVKFKPAHFPVDSSVMVPGEPDFVSVTGPGKLGTVVKSPAFGALGDVDDRVMVKFTDGSMSPVSATKLVKAPVLPDGVVPKLDRLQELQSKSSGKSVAEKVEFEALKAWDAGMESLSQKQQAGDALSVGDSDAAKEWFAAKYPNGKPVTAADFPKHAKVQDAEGNTGTVVESPWFPKGGSGKSDTHVQVAWDHMGGKKWSVPVKDLEKNTSGVVSAPAASATGTGGVGSDGFQPVNLQPGWTLEEEFPNGTEVKWKPSDKEYTGTVSGIAYNGFLKIDTPDGLATVPPGNITHKKPVPVAKWDKYGPGVKVKNATTGKSGTIVGKTTDKNGVAKSKVLWDDGKKSTVKSSNLIHTSDNFPVGSKVVGNNGKTYTVASSPFKSQFGNHTNDSMIGVEDENGKVTGAAASFFTPVAPPSKATGGPSGGKAAGMPVGTTVEDSSFGPGTVIESPAVTDLPTSFTNTDFVRVDFGDGFVLNLPVDELTTTAPSVNPFAHSDATPGTVNAATIAPNHSHGISTSNPKLKNMNDAEKLKLWKQLDTQVQQGQFLTAAEVKEHQYLDKWRQAGADKNVALPVGTDVSSSGVPGKVTQSPAVNKSGNILPGYVHADFGKGPELIHADELTTTGEKELSVADLDDAAKDILLDILTKQQAAGYPPMTSKHWDHLTELNEWKAKQSGVAAMSKQQKSDYYHELADKGVSFWSEQEQADMDALMTDPDLVGGFPPGTDVKLKGSDSPVGTVKTPGSTPDTVWVETGPGESEEHWISQLEDASSNVSNNVVKDFPVGSTVEFGSAGSKASGTVVGHNPDGTVQVDVAGDQYPFGPNAITPKNTVAPQAPAQKSFTNMTVAEKKARAKELMKKKATGGGLTAAETSELAELKSWNTDMGALKKQWDNGETLTAVQQEQVKEFWHPKVLAPQPVTPVKKLSAAEKKAKYNALQDKLNDPGAPMLSGQEWDDWVELSKDVDATEGGAAKNFPNGTPVDGGIQGMGTVVESPIVTNGEVLDDYVKVDFGNGPVLTSVYVLSKDDGPAAKIAGMTGMQKSQREDALQAKKSSMGLTEAEHAELKAIEKWSESMYDRFTAWENGTKLTEDELDELVGWHAHSDMASKDPQTKRNTLAILNGPSANLTEENRLKRDYLRAWADRMETNRLRYLLDSSSLSGAELAELKAAFPGLQTVKTEAEEKFPKGTYVDALPGMFGAGTVTESPAVDPDGIVHPDMVEVDWGNGNVELVDISELTVQEDLPF